MHFIDESNYYLPFESNENSSLWDLLNNSVFYLKETQGDSFSLWSDFFPTKIAKKY